MAEKMDTNTNANRRLQSFLESICNSSHASANALERELATEKNKRRTELAKIRKLKYRIKDLTEKMLASEVAVDNSNIKIIDLEERLNNAIQDTLSLR